jgi:hypothetical protein
VKLLPSILPPEVELLAKYEPPKYQYFRFGIENKKNNKNLGIYDNTTSPFTRDEFQP